MNKNKMSVVFQDNNGNTIEEVQINKHIYFHWKKYASLIIICCIAVTYLYIDWSNQQFNSKLEKEIATIEASNIQAHQKTFLQSLTHIDNYVNEVNEVLQQKGLATIPNIDAAAILQNGNEAMVAQSYIHQLQSISDNLSATPLGLPHVGAITSSFGFRIDPVTGAPNDAHQGIDFKGMIGDPIKATAHGKIAFAGPKGGYGNCVIIEHEQGYKTLYAHLSAINVKPGQQVQSGNVIGKLGNTGKSTGPHLHYEVMKNDVKVNPAKFLKL